MERTNVRRAPQAIKHFEPVYPHDPSCIYIPYPVPKVSQPTVDDSVDDRVKDSVDRIVEQRTDDATTIADARKHKPGAWPGLSLRSCPGNNRIHSQGPIPKLDCTFTSMTTDLAQLDEVSKYLSYILRHEPHAIGLQLDSEGWADIDSLIACASKQGRVIDKAMIQAVVATNNKKRFAFSDDRQRIRAVQGHSISTVRPTYPEKVPPVVLYHGTATRFLASIREQGLKAGSRHHVHLSLDIPTAIAVGKRHGKPVALEIQALRMHQQGFKFFLAENKVWLTDAVPAEFISTIG
jgi:putative RNA 2'-phosphotransferase